MSSIYANAYITIVASGGADADHGLLGVGGGSHPRNYNQFKCKFTSDSGWAPIYYLSIRIDR